MPRKISPKNNKREESDFDWKNFASGFASNFIKSVTSSLFEKFNDFLEKFLQTLQKGFTGMFLMFLGLVFILIGLAIFINDLVAVSDGLGYSIIGISAFLFGYIIIKK
jgi:hypothetical protein